jgi:transcription elongation factor GreB
MSRAFVKEIDDQGPEAPPELKVSPHPNRVTARGLRLIEARLAELDAKIAKGPEESELAWLRRDQRYWAQRLASAQLVEPPQEPGEVGFGTRVTFRRGGGKPESVEIVGEDEADPAAGRISWVSPLAAAMMGAEAGEVVELPGRGVEIEVLAIGAVRTVN